MGGPLKNVFLNFLNLTWRYLLCFFSYLLPTKIRRIWCFRPFFRSEIFRHLRPIFWLRRSRRKSRVGLQSMYLNKAPWAIKQRKFSRGGWMMKITWVSQTRIVISSLEGILICRAKISNWRLSDKKNGDTEIDVVLLSWTMLGSIERTFCSVDTRITACKSLGSVLFPVTIDRSNYDVAISPGVTPWPLRLRRTGNTSYPLVI